MTDKPRKRRKRRNDRNHLVYKLTCAVDGSFYIGITFVDKGKKEKSLDRRWRAHLRNALDYGKENLLSVAIRTHTPESFTQEILHVVRGKQACHDLERELIQELRPHLNMEGMGRKKTSKKEN
jgi:hypothetical protein